MFNYIIYGKIYPLGKRSKITGRRHMVSNEEAIECTRRCMGEHDIALCFIDCILGSGPIEEARRLIEVFRESVEEASRLYGFRKTLYSREFGSFLKDPRMHLRKKLFIYTHDLVRGRLKPEDYGPRAAAAIRTSLQTNLRTLYQNWVFTSIVNHLYRRGSKVIYPEHGVLSFERSGKQKLRWIPPNLVIDIPGIGALSFFLEVPRPLAWEDTSDLRSSWKLYTALRPDIMVYGGVVMDIVSFDSNPPIRKPDIIIECKELIDWYNRVRDVKGPLAKPLSAEEWRNLWIQGLWDGLADVLGVSRREAIERARERRGIRLSEVKIVQLYRSIYNPDKMILVSKYGVPDEVKEMLRGHDILVYDNIGFDKDKLKPIAEIIREYAKAPEKKHLVLEDNELTLVIEKIISIYRRQPAIIKDLKNILEKYEK